MAKKKKLSSRTFHTAREEIKTHLHTKIAPKRQYAVAFLDQEFLLREELRPVRLQLELLRPELVLQDNHIDKALVFFGSARLPSHEMALAELEVVQSKLNQDPDNAGLQKALKRATLIAENSAYLQQAEQLAFLAGSDPRANFVVVTGGGPSFMEAANKGAYLANARSIALNMMLPGEQEPNPYVTPELTFQFHYFAIRKMHFLMRAKALAAFPGGYGTFDELFEVLTLMQTEKIDRIPLLLFNKKFWQRIINFEGLVLEGTIREKDLDLIHYVETAEEAWEYIVQFYNL